MCRFILKRTRIDFQMKCIKSSYGIHTINFSSHCLGNRTETTDTEKCSFYIIATLVWKDYKVLKKEGNSYLQLSLLKALYAVESMSMPTI